MSCNRRLGRPQGPGAGEITRAAGVEAGPPPSPLFLGSPHPPSGARHTTTGRRQQRSASRRGVVSNQLRKQVLIAFHFPKPGTRQQQNCPRSARTSSQATSGGRQMTPGHALRPAHRPFACGTAQFGRTPRPIAESASVGSGPWRALRRPQCSQAPTLNFDVTQLISRIWLTLGKRCCCLCV